MEEISLGNELVKTGILVCIWVTDFSSIGNCGTCVGILKTNPCFQAFSSFLKCLVFSPLFVVTSELIFGEFSEL